MIRKRRDGLQVRVYAGRDPFTGRKRYVSQQVAGQTKASMRQAKQIEARLLEEVGAGRHSGSRSGTMAELLERWLGWWPTVRPIAPTTVSSCRAAMDRYILPALGNLPGRQVDAATHDAFYAQLRTRGGKDGRPLKASTVHEVHAVLSGALKQAVVWGWIAWVIQAGQSIHLRVLPPPTVAPEPVEPAATLPVTAATLPLPVEQLAPVGIAAAVALAGRMVRRVGQRVDRRRERAGRLPTPARRPWLSVPPPAGTGTPMRPRDVVAVTAAQPRLSIGTAAGRGYSRARPEVLAAGSSSGTGSG